MRQISAPLPLDNAAPTQRLLRRRHVTTHSPSSWGTAFITRINENPCRNDRASSRTFIDISLSSATDLLDPQNLDRSPASSSYRQYTPVSRQNPPTAVFDASENRVRLEGRSSKCYIGADKVHPRASNPSSTNHRQNSRSPSNSGPRARRRPGFAMRQSKSAPATMRGIPTEADKRLTNKRPGRTAKETCVRKPTSCDTCLAEGDARDVGHSARILCSLRRLWDGNVAVSASGSMIHPNTRSCVSQVIVFLADKRGASKTSRSPNKRKWSDTSDCTARKQRRPSDCHCNFDENAIVYVVPH